MALNSETVEVEIGDERIILTPSIEAYMAVSHAIGGLREAYEKAQKWDVSAICSIIAAGGGLTIEEGEALPSKIYESGATSSCAVAAQSFCNLLNNGGKREKPKAKPAKKDGAATS